MRKSRNLNQIDEALGKKNPELIDNETLVLTAQELDDAEAIDATMQSEGGQIYLKKKKDEVITSLLGLFNLAKGEHQPQQLLYNIARLESAFNVVYELSKTYDTVEDRRKVVDSIIEQSV